MILIRRYPVTLLLLAQYVPFVIIPALRYGTEGSGFIFGLLACGLATSVAVESVFVPLGTSGGKQRRIHPLSAVIVTSVGLIATLGATLLGARTYGLQLGAIQVSKAASFLTPLQSWLVVGPLFGFYAARNGWMSKRGAFLLAGGAVAASFVNSLLSQILFTAFTVALALTFGALLCNMIRVRWIVLCTVAAVLLWPVLYNVRNQGRVVYAPTQFAAQPPNSASERLRLDKNMSLAANFTAPPNLGAPSLLQMFRYGLIPRALDPDPNRPTISTGQLLNAALGGSPNSSFSFTVLGNLDVLAGLHGMILYVAAIAASMAFAVRRRGVGALVFACLLVQQCLWIESTYPDGIGALIQGLTSSVVAFVFLTILERLLMARRRGAAAEGTSASGDAAMEPGRIGQNARRTRRIPRPKVPYGARHW